MRRFGVVSFVARAIILAACALAPPGAMAETIRIGTIKIALYAPIFIAQEKGYFAAEGLAAELVFFQAAEPVSVAVVSGDLDFGVTGTSGGFYNLAGHGSLRIIAAGAREVPGFQFFTLIASNPAYDRGLTSFKDLAGHSVAVSQIGSPAHYSLALIAEKSGVDLKTIRVLPLQSIPNILSAVRGGQADAAIMNANSAMPAIGRGEMKLIGYAGDVAPWQVVTVYTGAATANNRHDTVARFLRAYRKGARDYHDAFTSPDGTRKNGPTAGDILAILAKYTDQPVEQIKLALPFIDADGRLDVADIVHQIGWFRSQGMLKTEFDPQSIIDRRYVIPLPGP